MHTGNLHAGGDNKLAMIYGSNSQIDQSSHQHHDYSTHHHASGFQDFIAFCKAVIQDNKVLSIVAIGALFYTGKRLYNWQQADVAIVNLSEPVEHFILRHIELQRLQQRFQRQTTAIKEAAIVGITGAGKSELGKAYARAYRDSWFHPQKAYYLKKPLFLV